MVLHSYRIPPFLGRYVGVNCLGFGPCYEGGYVEDYVKIYRVHVRTQTLHDLNPNPKTPCSYIVYT